ncbi:MAG: type I DNA topoisomerase [Pseudomonadota bacterium]|nr:type I DNA topoisomerase [Pseudomonadota bacterium]
MQNTLVVVESPAKAKAIQGYLGKGFKVLASYGHIRDLVPKTGAVEPDHDFRMHYTLIDKNKPHSEAIAKAAKSADTILLATDLDREGEAISWHIKEYLEEKNITHGKTVKRIVFNQVTKKAIQDSLEHMRDLSDDLIHAQQARRVLDYLVGFNLSPLLWKKIRTGLSAGRVQSPALRMIVEREYEIESFKRQEYWSVPAKAQADQKTFDVRLVSYEGNKLSQFSITEQKHAEKVQKKLSQMASHTWSVSDIIEKTKRKEPPAPFITSTLLQESVKKLYMSSARTMRAAQQLYEGIEIAGQRVGLITYMRTDSYHIAQEACDQIRGFITDAYGKEACPSKARVFKSASKNAQEAHECIRPADISRDKDPSFIRQHLSDDQFKLYKMIWQRTLASQMQSAELNQTRIDIQHSSKPDLATFRANGTTIKYPGYLLAYQEGKDDDETSDTDEKHLPKLTKGQTVSLTDINPKQHFTEPPARFSEASLIKNLKDLDIGRPSTYASIISTIKDRGYAIVENKRFVPTDIGKVVTRFLTSYFLSYVDYQFTANLEDELDQISRGELEWKPTLKSFWTPFCRRVEEINDTVQRKDVTEQPLDESCPECKKPLVVKLGRNGNFIGCSGYPDCQYTRDSGSNTDQKPPEEAIDRPCPVCESPLAIKSGRYGKFIGCSKYPECKHIEPLNKPEDTQVTCPNCHKGTLLKRRARRGNFFYSCSQYPKCKYLQSDAPVEKPCSECGFPITMLKVTKKYGEQHVCPKCKHAQ